MLIRQTILYMPAQFVAPAAQFASMLIWTWWLQPAELGTFVLVTATQELAALFSLAWLSNYVLRYMPTTGDAATRTRYLQTETAVLLVMTLPQVLTAALIVIAIEAGGQGLVEIAAISAFFVTRTANTHFGDRARSQGAILPYTLLQAAGPLGGLLLGMAALEVFPPTATTLLLAYAVAQSAACLLVAPLIGFSWRPGPVDRDVIRAAIGYGGPLLGLSLFGWAAENVFRYVVEHNAGAAAFGLVAVGWGIGRRCASVGSMLVAAAAFPIAARMLNEGQRDGALRQLTVNAALLTAVLFPMVAGLSMVGGLLVDLTIAETYRQTTKDVLVLATLSGALRYFHLHVTDQLFVLERRFGYAALVAVVEAVAIFVLCLLALDRYGLTEAVAAAAAGSAIAVAVSAGLAVGRMGFVFPLLDMAKVTAASAIMAAGLSLTPYPHSVFGLVLAVVCGGLYYAAAMALLYLPLLLPRLKARFGTA